MENTRRYKRFRLDFLEVNGQLTFATEVTLLDISMGGISLKADRRLNIGGKYVIKLDDKKKIISLKGEVAWSSLSGNKVTPDGEIIPLYTAGMRFIDLSREKTAELQHFVEIHRKEEVPAAGDRRLTVRFLIAEPGKAILNYPQDYKVKVISLSGMLIETSHALECESRIPMELSLHDESRISFLGRVVNCQMTGKSDGERYDIGIEFLNLTDKDRDVLGSFVAYVASMKLE
jgi:Tfp pilus assembly protein PilZ